MRKFSYLAVMGVVALLLAGCSKPMVIESSYDPEVDIFAVDEANEFDGAPLAVLLPSDMSAVTQIAMFYSGLAAVVDPTTVFVIGPNRSNLGEANIQTCKKCLYETRVGELELDGLSRELEDDGVAAYFDELFLDESTVLTHAPFIKNYFPNAKIVPILLKSETTTEELDALVEWLNGRLYSDTLVIGSSEFSKYQPPSVAGFHDQAAITTIRNFDYENIYDLELDSPSTIYTVMKLMELRGYMDAQRVAHNNLSEIIVDYDDEVTTYPYWGFFEGEIEAAVGVSILSMGDFDDDESLVFGSNWRWDPTYDEGADLTLNRYLRDLRGVEDRFFVGSDFLVFELEDNGCRYEEQNGMGVSFCKFVEGYEEIEGDFDMYDIVSLAASESDLVYLMFEFDGGNLTKSRQEIAAIFIKSGADIFIGRGLNDGIVPFKTYEGGLIFYSLGDFITDSKLTTELDEPDAGMVLGLYVTLENYEIYAFPVEVVNGYPKLLDQSLRTKVFMDFIGSAKLTKDKDIDPSKGVLKIKR